MRKRRWGMRSRAAKSGWHPWRACNSRLFPLNATTLTRDALSKAVPWMGPGGERDLAQASSAGAGAAAEDCGCGPIRSAWEAARPTRPASRPGASTGQVRDQTVNSSGARDAS